MHILLVDDSEELLLLLRSVLSRLGCEVSCATNIPDARTVSNFDLAFVDWNLADGNGLDLLEEFNKRSNSPGLILMSATKPDQAASERLLSIGASYEPKPISPIRLKKIAAL